MTDNLRLEIDWLGTSSAVRSAELRATWARLTISVGDDVVTLVEDLSNMSVRRSIYVSLYPLAEWIATNWWLLRFDGHGFRRFDAERRHTTLGAGAGFLWPDLRIVPEGEFTELTWWSDRRPRVGADCRYLAQGAAVVPSTHTARELEGLVTAVIERLDEAGLNDTPLHKEWRAAIDLDEEEAEFAEAAARLGLDPFSDGIDFAELIESAFTSLEPGIRNDFLDAVSPDGIEHSLDWVARSLLNIPSGEDGLDLDRIRSQFETPGVIDGRPPWERGWESARQVRNLMGENPSGPIETLPIDLVVDEMARRHGIVGIGRGSDIGLGVVVSRSMTEVSRRFHRARAVWHALTRDPGTPFLLTSSVATSQRIGRAFAAELLVPAAGLKDYLSGDYTSEAIDEAANYFRAPLDVVQHQVENQLAA